MRSFAAEKIKQIAVAAGLPAASIMDKPAKDIITLPRPRLELEYLSETFKRTPRRVAKFKSKTDPNRYKTVRHKLYQRKLTVSATVQADDEAWLEAFVLTFLTKLPGKVADASGNLVSIEAQQAVRGGFGNQLVEVFKKRSNALHITFTGMLCRDEEIPLITDVNLRDGVSYEENGNG